MQKALNSWAQRGDDQSGCSLTTKSTRAWGMGVGRGDASGTACRKMRRLLRDSASAGVFSTPGRWAAWMWISWYATTKNMHLNMCIMILSFARPEFTTATTAILSQWHSTRLPDHHLPHTTIENRIGSNFFSAICHSSARPSTSTETTGDPNAPHSPRSLRHHSPMVLFLALCWASRKFHSSSP